ncbi:AAA family ATPase [Neisseria sp. CCUG12390]|uniref:AAA family ATPase n=1 Tax=Neisseria sp. CCUG12390 TaxID=3392035 RepID=UPI003A0FD189
MMEKKIFDGIFRFEQVKGVGTMQVNFLPNQRVYTLIGENGVGKTKFLECVFTVLLLTNRIVRKAPSWVHQNAVPFKKTKSPIGEESFTSLDESIPADLPPNNFDIPALALNCQWGTGLFSGFQHDWPIVYLAAQNRGGLQHVGKTIEQMGSFKHRSERYFQQLFSVLYHKTDNFKSLNMDTNIEEWIIQRAQSANPYQSKEDNRKIEIDTLLHLLNNIDGRIDRDFLEISGNNRVFIRVEGKKTELSDLSSGFTSIFKIIQSIIAGYSYFTNEVQIAHVRGVVLIDEIESHLHNEWQVKIVPLLKKLFPNTTFVITTHSSLVISQLEQGEAYRLKRNKEDGVVYGEVIDYPSQASFVDLLNEAFGVDLNSLKIERAKKHGQQQAKKALLDLVNQELGKSGE